MVKRETNPVSPFEHTTDPTLSVEPMVDMTRTYNADSEVEYGSGDGESQSESSSSSSSSSDDVLRRTPESPFEAGESKSSVSPGSPKKKKKSSMKVLTRKKTHEEIKEEFKEQVLLP